MGDAHLMQYVGNNKQKKKKAAREMADGEPPVLSVVAPSVPDFILFRPLVSPSAPPLTAP